MTDFTKLRAKIDASGLSMVEVSRRTKILRATLYNRMAGTGEFTASEIMALTKCLGLTRKEREEIFFSQKV